MKYSREAAELWNEYADEFERRWGIDREVSAIIGARSRTIFDAEFKENGESVYRTSVVLPIRNAFYSASAIDERWKELQGMSLVEPILDYGCGVGYQLLWLQRHGFKKLYGYEIHGVQRNILVRMLGNHLIPMWREGLSVNTILCMNVLEHVTEPLAMLTKLLTICPRVIANVDTSYQDCHIASHEDLEECRRILEERETLYRAA